MKRISLVFLFALLLAHVHVPGEAYAQEPIPPNCRWENGEFVCDEGGGGGGDDDGGTCASGTHIESAYRENSGGVCVIEDWEVDNCTGERIRLVGWSFTNPRGPCSRVPANNPCETLVVGPGGITCGTRWELEARVGFPVTYLDLRPYPATLVRWPTAARNGGMSSASGSGSLDYLPNGGRSAGNPRPGDWRFLTLTLTLRPAMERMELTLPNIGTFSLLEKGTTGQPTIFHWEVPSHPAAGGGPLAGTISGLDELPTDIPVFVGQARSPYRLFWQLSWEEYTLLYEDSCVAGSDGDGNYTCRTTDDALNNDGHWARIVVGAEWEGHGQNGEILPLQVSNLPTSLMADLNRDGTPDAYWNTNVTIRRMNDANFISDPVWRRSWNWGGIVYWAVREGQGQIGWPGVP